MNNKVLFVLGVFLAAIAFSQVAQAANFELTVFPDEISVCPCSAITPQHVSVSVKNLHYSTDSYTFTLTVPAGWGSQIQKDMTLAPGEEGNLDLFLVNVNCNVPAGVYTATVTAKSETTGETISETLSIEVLVCRGVEMTAEEKHKEVCFEEAIPVTYGMNIKNLGKFRETFKLSSVEWAGFSEAEVTLEPGESKPFSVVLNPEALPMGLHTVTIYARSTDPQSPLYYAPVTETLELEVKDCYDFSVDLQPQENTVCFGKSLEYTLSIENIGLNADSYSIYTPDWITSEVTELGLGPGEKASVRITATPGTLGTTDLSVTVTSSNEPDLSKKADASVISEECRSVAVIVFPSEHTVCGGMPPVGFDVSVKNTGTIEDVYQLTTSMGTLESESLALNPGETKTTRLEVDTTGVEGILSITVTASDGVVSDEANIELIVENCYSANLTITPDMQSICPYDSVSYTVTIQNTGELPDTYTLRYGDETETLELNSKELGSFELTFLVPFEESGVYVVSAFADSNHVSLTETAALNVKSMETCYGAELQVEEEKWIKPCTIEECEAATIPVEIKNKGEKPASYILSFEGPDWVHLEPTGFDLGAGESGIAYLYVSLDFGVAEDTYPVTIYADSEYTELEKAIGIIVAENVTVPEEPDITLNISLGNVTGAVIGGERPLWKTVVVAVIAIIIIIILIVRFVLLVKK